MVFIRLTSLAVPMTFRFAAMVSITSRNRCGSSFDTVASRPSIAVNDLHVAR
jgi:hypothetical protein